MDDSTDDLLAALGQAARETPDAPGAWVDHAAGTLDPQARMALRGVAVDDRQTRDALAMLEPLGSEFDEALTDRLLAEVAPAAAPADTRAGRSRWAVMGGVVLLAAAVALAFGLTRRTALPAYQFDLQAGERVIRGADPAAERADLYPDSRIALTVRPAEAVEGAVTVGAFVRQGSTVTPFSPAVTCAATGACKVDGIVGDLMKGLTGEATLVFVVTRPDAMPTAAELDGFEPRFERPVHVRTD